jgi:hypothetical protein
MKGAEWHDSERRCAMALHCSQRRTHVAVVYNNSPSTGITAAVALDEKLPPDQSANPTRTNDWRDVTVALFVGRRDSHTDQKSKACLSSAFWSSPMTGLKFMANSRYAGNLRNGILEAGLRLSRTKPKYRYDWPKIRSIFPRCTRFGSTSHKPLCGQLLDDRQS